MFAPNIVIGITFYWFEAGQKLVRSRSNYLPHDGQRALYLMETHGFSTMVRDTQTLDSTHFYPIMQSANVLRFKKIRGFVSVKMHIYYRMFAGNDSLIAIELNQSWGILGRSRKTENAPFNTPTDSRCYSTTSRPITKGNYTKSKITLHHRQQLFEPRHDKANIMTVRPAMTQISLGIRPVWSESSLCTYWVA